MSELIRSIAKSPYRPGGPYTPPVQPMTFPEDEPAPIQFPEKGKVPFVNPFDPSQVKMVDEPKQLSNAQKAIKQRALAQQASRRRM
jgi:hypothetical protein